MNRKIESTFVSRSRRPYTGLALGNSHLAAFRMAYTSCESIPDWLKLDFLASGRAGLANLALDGGAFIATSVETEADFLRFGQRKRVPLCEYDFFVVIGLGFNVYGLEALYREYRCSSFKNYRSEKMKRRLVSDAVFRHMIANGLRGCLSGQVAHIIRQGTDKPIFQIPQPRPSESLLSQKNYPSLRRAVRHNDSLVLDTLFEEAASLVCSFGYLPQPPETKAYGLLTSTRYTEESPRLAADLRKIKLQPSTDFLHANSLYGEQVLCQLLEALC